MFVPISFSPTVAPSNAIWFQPPKSNKVNNNNVSSMTTSLPTPRWTPKNEIVGSPACVGDSTFPIVQGEDTLASIGGDNNVEDGLWGSIDWYGGCGLGEDGNGNGSVDDVDGLMGLNFINKNSSSSSVVGLGLGLGDATTTTTTTTTDVVEDGNNNKNGFEFGFEGDVELLQLLNEQAGLSTSILGGACGLGEEGNGSSGDISLNDLMEFDTHGVGMVGGGVDGGDVLGNVDWTLGGAVGVKENVVNVMKGSPIVGKEELGFVELMGIGFGVSNDEGDVIMVENDDDEGLGLMDCENKMGAATTVNSPWWALGKDFEDASWCPTPQIQQQQQESIPERSPATPVVGVEQVADSPCVTIPLALIQSMLATVGAAVNTPTAQSLSIAESLNRVAQIVANAASAAAASPVVPAAASPVLPSFTPIFGSSSSSVPVPVSVIPAPCSSPVDGVVTGPASIAAATPTLLATGRKSVKKSITTGKVSKKSNNSNNILTTTATTGSSVQKRKGKTLASSTCSSSSSSATTTSNIDTSGIIEIRDPETQERKFKCPLCPLTDRRSYNVKVHMTTHGPREKTIVCELCDTKFGRVYEKNRHYKRIHNIIVNGRGKTKKVKAE
ncbi:hypothetical protein HDU76_009258 [Blyttiomyces sp. JEL0837]|nr:hypothetical protein HDU76_009258 [Blyttiomyces sp. JEL0837]